MNAIVPSMLLQEYERSIYPRPRLIEVQSCRTQKDTTIVIDCMHTHRAHTSAHIVVCVCLHVALTHVGPRDALQQVAPQAALGHVLPRVALTQAQNIVRGHA
jgi:hypothetical protein